MSDNQKEKKEQLNDRTMRIIHQDETKNQEQDMSSIVRRTHKKYDVGGMIESNL